MKSAHELAVTEALALLERARKAPDANAAAELAIPLARALLVASQSSTEAHERERADRLAALMDDRVGQAFATALTDRVQRSSSGERVVGAVRHLVETWGVPRSLPHWDRLQLRALNRFGSAVPELAARALRERIRQDAAPYVVPAAPEVLDAFLRERRQQNVRVNVNHLGEQVLGQEDAERYLGAYIELLRRSEVDTISVKLSSIDSNVDLTSFDRTLSRLCDKLARIYRTAMAGERGPKLVYLDMEAYRDLDLTLEVFRRVLSKPEFHGLTAGIVLQAYVPDSFKKQAALAEWAAERVRGGGMPVRLRLVKGANLMMERIEASLEGFALPIYESKHEVDANFKRMLRFACDRERARSVVLGVGSHNLFDIALTLLLRAQAGLEAEVELEMLEGMADPLRRTVQRVAGRVLVYAPSVDDKEFAAAVAYLVRRLDENTSEQNFLRHSFAMLPDDASFLREAERFTRALGAADTVGSSPRRKQNRRTEEDTPRRAHFENEPNTDFSLSQNRTWLAEELALGTTREFEPLSSRVAGVELPGTPRDGFDPSRPGVVPYRYAVLDRADVRRAIDRAAAAARAWAATPAKQRETLLLAVADGLRRARGELILAMVLDAGKRPLEADAEVSEAVDFAEYYARQHARLRERFDLAPKGLVVVTPPWNFPLAIGLGSALAALVAGNGVLLKPPPETPLVLARAAAICWEAGIPGDALGLVFAEDEDAEPLITDLSVDVVMLTGGSETARAFRRLRLDLDLIAETGGKNALIVSALSDREQAIQHAVKSAFGHSGQKCSAASLLIVEREVYRSAAFRRQLADAVVSLPVGSAWQPENVVTPLIRPPSGALSRGLSAPGKGESFLVAPKKYAENPRLVGPGVLYGVTPSSDYYREELFGPLLGVMEARDLEHAIELANGVPYGLTAGIASLDEREQDRFMAASQAGNLYVNRPTTGAIVGRQPFGGRKASAFGHGAKAGGPNYLLGVARVLGERSRALASVPLSQGPRDPAKRRPLEPARKPDLGYLAPLVAECLKSADVEPGRELGRRIGSYERASAEEIGAVHAQDHVLGHEDVLLYQPARVLLVLGPDTNDLDFLATLSAAQLAGVEPRVLAHITLKGDIYEGLSPMLARYGSPAELRAELEAEQYDRLRLLGATLGELGVEPDVLPFSVEAQPVSDSGYVELRRYVIEQSRSIARHRYGNLGLKAEGGV
jgi:RHH-type proline utilization regulon transcriptional repressor/proline dehydrogenase/delta 1-pyrroline-5-carboxylate dehydrogenase